MRFRELFSAFEKSLYWLNFYFISLTKSERAEKLKIRYEKFLVSIGEFENKLFDDWSAEVTNISRENLQQPLMIKKLNKELALNFHPQVYSLET